MMIYDIKEFYVNVPIKETLMITKSIPLNDAQVTKEIITLLEIILHQNYFSFQTIYTNQKKESRWDPLSLIQ